ncbi:DUF2510 domain-containing protein [Leifsonia sp. C5G2]|uniref:DUF2510 domain-containing protein n=1 Tax=Leifsonia sp. C5G2 TaxID=2735269 RepID=UPI0015849FA3|nr:DUF2510 domain-containing protein [Leifsonia sp. C5G2]NUU06295.1 DUF2510 domain-containing protein [Leifsonia sp. C5G2]
MTYEATPAPGWYPDPHGSGALRWWDGTRWSDQLAAAPSPYTAPQRRRPLDPATPIFTVWIWLVVAIPGLSACLLFLLQPQVLFREIPGTSRVTISDPFALIGGPMYFVVIGLNWLLTAAFVVFSWLDYRELLRRGVERPFHWAWSFLGIVYPIGRSVVVRGVAAGRGLAPIWVAIGVYALTLIVSMIWVIRLAAEIIGTATMNIPAGA